MEMSQRGNTDRADIPLTREDVKRLLQSSSVEVLDLSQQNLLGVDLSGLDLSKANLEGANLSHTILKCTWTFGGKPLGKIIPMMLSACTILQDSTENKAYTR